MLKKLSDSFHSLSVWVVSNFDVSRREQGGSLKSSQSANMLHNYGVQVCPVAPKQRVVSSDDIHKIDKQQQKMSFAADSNANLRTPKKKKLGVFLLRDLRNRNVSGSIDQPSSTGRIGGMKRSGESINFHMHQSPSTFLSQSGYDETIDNANGNRLCSIDEPCSTSGIDDDHHPQNDLQNQQRLLCQNFDSQLELEGATVRRSTTGWKLKQWLSSSKKSEESIVVNRSDHENGNSSEIIDRSQDLIDGDQQQKRLFDDNHRQQQQQQRRSRKDWHFLKKSTDQVTSAKAAKIRRHSSAKFVNKCNEDDDGEELAKKTPTKKPEHSLLRSKNVSKTFVGQPNSTDKPICASSSSSTAIKQPPNRRRTARPKSEHFTSRLSTNAANDSPIDLFGRKENYERLEKLGEGSYATVYKGQSLIDGSVVALKEIRLQPEEGVPFTAIREASLLKGLKHANIVLLHDIVLKDSLTFVFEYVRGDLSQYLEKHPAGIHSHNVRLFLFQLLRGLAFCHDKKILHRDLKPQNLLISEIGELKLADFGLARAKSVPSHTYSHEVVTLWYRPPDVLLGSTTYSTSLDMWGVGCIFAEMLTGCALFPGAKDVYDQLDKIFRIRGTPTPATWEDVQMLPNYVPRMLNNYEQLPWRDVNPLFADFADVEWMLNDFLQMKPEDRISAKDAMSHPYFRSLAPAVHRLPHISSIFIVPDVKLVPELAKLNARSYRR